MNKFLTVILAIGVGNALEWFDFAIFGALADIIGYHFFPAKHSSAALMASFTLYCTAFFMRPLGGILMGYIGDTYGRKSALEISVCLMLIPSFLMGSLPTFQHIGFVATGALVVLRMLQGLAVGGEMIGAYIYTIEACEGKRRGLWGGVCKATALTGTVLGMGVVTLLREVLSEEDMYQWGWRIPFLSSILLGIVGIYLRSFLHESEEYLKIKASTEQVKEKGFTTVQAVRAHWPEVILGSLITAFWCTGYYTCFIWMGYYTSDLIRGDPVSHPWAINILMISALVLLMPLGGIIGDSLCQYSGNEAGFKRTLMLGCVLACFLGIPAFLLINMKSMWSVCLGQLLFAFSLSLYGSCMPVVLVTLFVTQYRYSAMGIAYNAANAVFAGTAPLIQTALVVHVNKKYTGFLASALPATYIMAVALLSFIALSVGPGIAATMRKRFNLDSLVVISGKSSIEVTASMDNSNSSAWHLDTSISPMIKS